MSRDPVEAFSRLTVALTRTMASDTVLRSLDGPSDQKAIGQHIAIFDHSASDAVSAFRVLAESDFLEEIDAYMAATYGGRP